MISQGQNVALGSSLTNTVRENRHKSFPFFSPFISPLCMSDLGNKQLLVNCICCCQRKGQKVLEPVHIYGLGVFASFFFFFLSNSSGFLKEILLNGLCKLPKWPESCSVPMQQKFIGNRRSVPISSFTCLVKNWWKLFAGSGGGPDVPSGPPQMELLDFSVAPAKSVK